MEFWVLVSTVSPETHPVFNPLVSECIAAIDILKIFLISTLIFCPMKWGLVQQLGQVWAIRTISIDRNIILKAVVSHSLRICKIFITLNFYHQEHDWWRVDDYKHSFIPIQHTYLVSVESGMTLRNDKVNENRWWLQLGCCSKPGFDVRGNHQLATGTHMHTHTNTYIYIYMYMYIWNEAVSIRETKTSKYVCI